MTDIPTMLRNGLSTSDAGMLDAMRITLLCWEDNTDLNYRAFFLAALPKLLDRFEELAPRE